MDFHEMPEKFDMAAYDLVGIGSGVYGGSFNRKLVNYISGLSPSVDKQKCFIFSTAGSVGGSTRAQAKIIKVLITKNRDVVGQWSCLGLDKFFVFKLFGGFNKGHPNKEDFDNLNN
jgi:flavodoxin